MAGDKLEANIRLNKQPFEDDLEEVKEKSEKTLEKIDDNIGKSNEKTDLAFLKSIATVQKMQSIMNKTLGFMGISIGKVLDIGITAVISTTAALYNIFQAETMTGFLAVNAAFGLVETTLALAQIPSLIRTSAEAGNLSSMFLTQTNSNIGSDFTVI